MPTTLVHGLVPALCADQLRRKMGWRERWRLFAAMFVLGNGADSDILPAALFPQYYSLIHREWGHNVFVLTLVTILGAWAIRRWVLPGQLTHRGSYALCTPVVFSHALFDAFGGPQSSGLPFLWPVSEQVWRIPLSLFPATKTPDTGHPLWEAVTHPQYWGYTVFFEAAFIAVVVVGFSKVLKRKTGGSVSLSRKAPQA